MWIIIGHNYFQIYIIYKDILVFVWSLWFSLELMFNHVDETCTSKTLQQFKDFAFSDNLVEGNIFPLKLYLKI